MIEIKNASKSYTTGEFTQKALDDVSVRFRKNEFVSILGPSGSGKTTLLNIIGGLDRYDSGDLIINGASTKDFKDSEWDAYRNNSVGFVFQSYNLIPHLSIIGNVELGMTLSGMSKKERRAKAEEALIEVGLKDHIHKKPNQLSGGQMQRVAIARALANDPDIILADEPTGALDSKTSVQILNLIKEISKDKLVIMVTHNEDLANEYSDRIISLLDGKIISDTNPVEKDSIDDDYQLKRTNMSFFTALNLSGNNILAKKWRTLLTAFASSIGIIGIALILSLSNGFDLQIQDFESNTLAEFPLMIMKEADEINAETMKEQREEMIESLDSDDRFTDKEEIYAYDREGSFFEHENILDKEFIEYLEKIDSENISGISYTMITNINLVKSDGERASEIDQQKINFAPYPKALEGQEESYLEKKYDVLAGRYPESYDELVIIVDAKNRIDRKILNELGIQETEKDETLDYDRIVGYEIKSIPNNIYYKEEGPIFMRNESAGNLIDLYQNEDAKTLKIVGIMRVKEDTNLEILQPGVAYSDDLMLEFIKDAKESDVVKAQEEEDYNVLTGQAFPEEEEDKELKKNFILASIGGNDIPEAITIYPSDFEAKENILNYIRKWNEGKEEEETIIYTDLAKTITDLTSEIMDAITLVLIAFASISLVVSLIMIGIITYISVLERTKEIGVLRALGARKKDITRVFNAETFIIGGVSGILAISITYLLIPRMNIVLEDLTGLEGIGVLNPVHAILLVVLSVTLTVLGGFIPAKMASKQDPVDALSEE